jgi:hypothetical protein
MANDLIVSASLLPAARSDAAADGARLPSAAGRNIALDLLRLLAAVQMVQGHTVDAVLAPAFRQGPVHSAWLSLRGLTSVAFLFAAGLAYHLSSLRPATSSGSQAGARARRLRRAFALILLGYALHLPVGLLSNADPSATARMLQTWLAVDILQCMGVSLLALELLTLAFPRPRALACACGFGAVLVLWASSRSAAMSDGLGPILQSYVTPYSGSIFPIFPWSAHMLFGVALGGLVLSPRRQGLRLALAAMATLGLSGALQRTAVLPAEHLGRLGAVMLGAALLSLLSPWAAAWPAALFQLARDTLFIYVFHIVLVYGEGVGLYASIGHRLSPGAAIALAAGVIGLTFAGAVGYARGRALRARRVGERLHRPARLARSTATG